NTSYNNLQREGRRGLGGPAARSGELGRIRQRERLPRGRGHDGAQDDARGACAPDFTFTTRDSTTGSSPMRPTSSTPTPEHRSFAWRRRARQHGGLGAEGRAEQRRPRLVREVGLLDRIEEWFKRETYASFRPGAPRERFELQ